MKNNLNLLNPKIKLYRSATVGIESADFKLLVDPWLTDGEYYGSWSHYPAFDFEKNLNEINSYDAIYISHIHPDHCSDETLKKINKNIPIYILSYHSKFLKFKLEKLGFKVIEIENFESTKLSKTFDLRIIAADNCDPELCYKFNGCANIFEKDQSQQIDSLAVITVMGKNILNVNDCPFELAGASLKKISKIYDNIDLMLLGYGGAGPYPQCVENFKDNEKEIESQKKRINFLEMSKKFIKEINPKYYLPFAGTYYLTGKLSNLQKFKGVPTIEDASKYLESNISGKSQCIRLNPGSTLSLNNFETSTKYIPIKNNEIEKYLNNVLSKRKLSYENEKEDNVENIYNLAKKAHLRFLEKKKQFNLVLDSDVLIKLKNKFIHIDNFNDKIDLKDLSEIKNINKYVIYDLDIRLLKNILLGPRNAHWNNAEIGSHIKFTRKPNVFERNIYDSMCFFHA